MKVKVLGADGNYSFESRSTSFLIEEHIAIDAGNLVEGLAKECCEVGHIFITHTHFDHVVDLPFILQRYLDHEKKPLKVYGLQESLETLQKHLFNWSIWPNFLEICRDCNGESLLEMIPVEYGQQIRIGDVKIMPIKANHTIPTCGFRVQKGKQAFVLSGDTYLNDALIELLNTDRTIGSLFIDVSFSSDQEEMAEMTKHLTPKLLQKMFEGLKRDDLKVYTYHQKHHYTHKIDQELNELGLLLNGGKRLETGDSLELA